MSIRKKRDQILETIKQQQYFQSVKGKHKEKATCVSDLIVGLTYINRPLLSMFPLYSFLQCAINHDHLTAMGSEPAITQFVNEHSNWLFWLNV